MVRDYPFQGEEGGVEGGRKGSKRMAAALRSLAVPMTAFGQAGCRPLVTSSVDTFSRLEVRASVIARRDYYSSVIYK